MSYQSNGKDHAAVANELLDILVSNTADAHTGVAAQVHATLAVADAIDDLVLMLTELHVVTHRIEGSGQ